MHLFELNTYDPSVYPEYTVYISLVCLERPENSMDDGTNAYIIYHTNERVWDMTPNQIKESILAHNRWEDISESFGW